MQTTGVPDAQARAEWLDEVLAESVDGKAHLVGLSSGGALALNQAVRRPGRLVSVAALEPARALAPVRAGFVFRALLNVLTRSGCRAEAFVRWCRGGRAIQSPMRELLVAGLTDFRTRAVPPPPRPTDEQLRSIRLPLLVLLGARSPVHDPRKAAQRACLAPHARVEIIEDAAHGLFTEQPELVATSLTRLFDELDQRPSQPETMP